MSYPPTFNRDMAQQYLRQQIEQAGPVEQVILLYDGAMKFLLQARAAIEANDIQARCNANRRAMEIVGYLVNLVNPETDGEVGKRLFGIYSGMLRKMLEIDFQNSIAVCDELVEGFRTLRMATAKALAESKAAAAPTGAVVAAPRPDDEALDALRRNAVA